MRITVFTLVYLGATLAITAMLAVSALASATPEQLLINPGFEDGTTGWTKYGGTLSIVDSPVHSGDSAASLKSTSSTDKWLYQTVQIQGGATYNFCGFAIKNDANIELVKLRITWCAHEGDFCDRISDVSSVILMTNSPEYRYLEIIDALAPNDSKIARVEVVLDPASSATVTAYFDDLSFTGPPPATATPSPSPTSSASPSPSPTPTPTTTLTATAQATPTSNPAHTPTPEPSATPTPGAEATATPDDHTTASLGDILINEVQYNPPQPGADAAFEWVELFNPTGGSIELRGWSIIDNYLDDPIPNLAIAPSGFAIVAATEGFYTNFPDVECPVVFIGDGAIGNGLSNDGDRLTLKDGAGTVIDAISYGGDSSIMSPPAPRVSEGHSIERSPAGGGFIGNPDPSPCGGFVLPVVTSSPTPIASLTAALAGNMTALPESNRTATPTLAETASQPDETPAYGGAAVRAAAIAGTLALLAAAFWIGHKRKPEKKRKKERLP